MSASSTGLSDAAQSSLTCILMEAQTHDTEHCCLGKGKFKLVITYSRYDLEVELLLDAFHYMHGAGC